jgi:hypothetical protein
MISVNHNHHKDQRTTVSSFLVPPKLLRLILQHQHRHKQENPQQQEIICRVKITLPEMPQEMVVINYSNDTEQHHHNADTTAYPCGNLKDVFHNESIKR